MLIHAVVLQHTSCCVPVWQTPIKNAFIHSFIRSLSLLKLDKTHLVVHLQNFVTVVYELCASWCVSVTREVVKLSTRRCVLAPRMVSWDGRPSQCPSWSRARRSSSSTSSSSSRSSSCTTGRPSCCSWSVSGTKRSPYDHRWSLASWQTLPHQTPHHISSAIVIIIINAHQLIIS